MWSLKSCLSEIIIAGIVCCSNNWISLALSVAEMRSNLVPVLKIHSTEMRQMWAEKTVAVHKMVTESSEQFCVFYH